jgi:hypothetical protein
MWSFLIKFLSFTRQHGPFVGGSLHRDRRANAIYVSVLVGIGGGHRTTLPKLIFSIKAAKHHLDSPRQMCWTVMTDATWSMESWPHHFDSIGAWCTSPASICSLGAVLLFTSCIVDVSSKNKKVYSSLRYIYFSYFLNT